VAHPPERRPPSHSQRPVQGAPYGRYVAIAGAIALLGVLAWLLIGKPHVRGGLRPGQMVPPFAAPLAIGGLEGDPDIAVHANEGERGLVPACRERGESILNICELYERRPVVLALFINGGACNSVLSELQAAAMRYRDVSFAAVAVKGAHAEVGRLVRRRGLSFPVAFDRHGVLASLYGMLSCPQLSFIYPGGRLQGRTLPEQPSQAALESRVQALLAASKARGWQPS
jgi:hypothetical protein